jgi:hypothetical protein
MAVSVVLIAVQTEGSISSSQPDLVPATGFMMNVEQSPKKIN